LNYKKNFIQYCCFDYVCGICRQRERINLAMFRGGMCMVLGLECQLAMGGELFPQEEVRGEKE